MKQKKRKRINRRQKTKQIKRETREYDKDRYIEKVNKEASWQKDEIEKKKRINRKQKINE